MRVIFAQRDRFPRWLICAAFVLVAGSASAQQIAIRPALRAGDQFRLEVKRTRHNSSRPDQDSRSTTPVDVRVVSASTEGLTLEWVPGETTFDVKPASLDPLIVAAADVLKGLRLRISLNADGGFAGLMNQSEVAPKLQEAIDVMVRGLAARMPEDQRKGFQAFIGSALSPAALLALVTNDAQTYFGLNGITITVGEALEAAIQQPNPLGRGVLPATFRIRAESATEESAALATTTSYDPAAFRELTRSLAAQAGKPISKEELDKMPPIAMGDEGRFVLDRALGLMREVIVNRRVTAGPMQRLDGWEIRLIARPAR